MTTDAPQITLDFDLPALPQTLARLTAVLADEDVNLNDVSAVIESDMSFAAAVMKSVNSPLYGLRGRVHSVQEAVTYLGIREVSALAYENGLQAAFPRVPALVAVWERARIRGLLMGRLAQALSMEAWGAHTAGLFEECGKAVLWRHAPDVYGPLLSECADDGALVARETEVFGLGHDEVGARLCEAWGLAPAAIASVRHHVAIQVTQRLPRVSSRYICVLSALAHTITTTPSKLDEVAMKLAPQAMLDQTSLLRGLQRVKVRIDEALQG
ncbi:MAG TPA: HDOD domain-containing protein [Burkholderiaceae bacterium]|jgi:HD-like signal output (HDOD) protein|nr:HDOD domain-containing protein [Burkholderiaceae bacterium]